MARRRKRLYLVDGANYVFRAYYALPRLSTSKGQPTGALYGFAQMLLKLIREEAPDYIAVCFDTPEPTFRDEMYKDYKANRKQPPDDLVQQFPHVHPIVEALGLPIVEKPGFEADDLIGTLAKRHASSDLDVVVVSGDKDLMQLIGENVSMLDEMKGRRIGPEEVAEKFGVGPEGVVEVLGLAGDSSDNVPGVPGVGLKTASKLIADYKTIEGVISNAEKIKGAVGKKVAEHIDEAKLSRRLVTLDTNVELEEGLGDLEPRGVDVARAREVFGELEFSRLMDELAPSRSISFEKYRLINKEKDLKDIVNTIENKGILSLDLETTSLDTMRADIVGFALAWAPGEAAYVPIGHGAAKAGETGDLFGGGEAGRPDQLPRDIVYKILKPILASPDIKKIGQNLNYDLTILKHLGFDVKGVAFDTMIASYVLNPALDAGLDALARTHLEHSTIRYEDVVGKGKSQKTFDQVEPDRARDYACEDADCALRLYEKFRTEIKDQGMSDLYYGMELPLVHVLVDMQLAGMKVDRKKLAALDADFGKRLAALEKKIYEEAGEEFNVNSPRQLGVVLFEKMGLPGAKKTKTGFSTSQPVLEELAVDHGLARLVLDYRSLSKLKSTYVEALPALVNPETGRVHTSFNQARAATGRLSSSDPNLQNIPVRGDEGQKIREAFVAEGGHVLVSADYSQIELRVLAHMSKDAALLDAFARGLDVHAMTASGIFGIAPEQVGAKQRAVGKTVNFATIYGQTAYGLSRQLGISAAEAAEYIDNYFKKYPGVATYRDAVLGGAKRDGFVTTLFGRRRFFPDIGSSNAQAVQVSERMAFNTVFQGSAADIIKRAMVDIHPKLKGVSAKSRMILQVHDELIFEVPKADVEAVSSFVKKRMEEGAGLDVPVVVGIGVGENWASAHP